MLSGLADWRSAAGERLLALLDGHCIQDFVVTCLGVDGAEGGVLAELSVHGSASATSLAYRTLLVDIELDLDILFLLSVFLSN